MKEYPVQRAAVLKPKPDPDTLVFGKTFTDHMFIMDYTAGPGLARRRIVPYGPPRPGALRHGAPLCPGGL